MTQDDRLLKIADVALRLAVSVSTVRRLIEAGELKTVRIGRALRILPDDLEAYIDNSKND